MQRALVDLAIDGDEEAFAGLARAMADRLLAIAYRILRDLGRAEDVVQQTMVTAWLELPSLRDPDRFEAWMHRLLVNACYKEAARANRWNQHIRVLPAVDPVGPDAFPTIADRDQLERGFRRLPAEQRAVLVFHHYLGLTLVETADVLAIPLGTVKSRLHYATNALRAALEADDRTELPSSRERLA